MDVIERYLDCGDLHFGFGAYCGNTTWPRNEEGLKILVRYIILDSFSQERMSYVAVQNSLDGKGKVTYTSRMEIWSKRLMLWICWRNWLPTFPTRANRWSGIMVTNRTNHGACGRRPALIDAEMAPNEFRKNCARLIQKIYQVGPLLCSKCQGPMKIVGFIEDNEIIEKILRHLGLCETRSHDPSKSGDRQPVNYKSELTYDITYSQLMPIDYWTR